MAKILDYANNISFNRFSRIRSSISNSGYARTQSGSPTFYSMEVNLPLLTKSQFDEVEAELIGLDDGVSFLTTTIPSSVNITNLKGTLDTNSTLLVSADATGSSVVIKGFNVDNTAANLQLQVGDYIKFPGTKVYQIKSTLNDSDTTKLNVTLNQGLITDVSTNDVVTVGQLVSFKFLLQSERPNVTVVPGPGYNYYQYDSFNFREVL